MALDDDINAILNELDFAGWASLIGEVDPKLRNAANEAGGLTLISLGLDSEEDKSIFEIANQSAVSFAQDRGAELVGMRIVDGAVVPNPNPQWAITDGTRSLLRAHVQRALEQGTSPGELQQEIIDGFAFSPARALNIARTETARAFGLGSLAAAKASGVVKTKEWVLSSEHPYEDECDQNEGAGAIPLGDAFPSGDDSEPAHPGCLIEGSVIAAFGIARHYERWYEGEIIVIRSAANDEIAVTPNHPILTDTGWLPASQLNDRSYVVKCLDPVRFAALVGPYDDYVEAAIEQVARSRRMSRGVTARSVPGTAIDFHHDGIFNAKVDIISTDSLFAHERKTARNKNIVEDLLDAAGRQRITLPSSRHCGSFAFGVNTTRRDMGSSGSLVSGLGSLPSGFNSTGLTVGSDRQTRAYKRSTNRETVNANGTPNVDARFASFIAGVQISEVRRVPFRGHVYNLQTQSGLYLASSLVVHNCECTVIYGVEEGEPAE